MNGIGWKVVGDFGFLPSIFCNCPFNTPSPLKNELLSVDVERVSRIVKASLNACARGIEVGNPKCSLVWHRWMQDYPDFVLHRVRHPVLSMSCTCLAGQDTFMRIAGLFVELLIGCCQQTCCRTFADVRPWKVLGPV